MSSLTNSSLPPKLDLLSQLRYPGSFIKDMKRGADGSIHIYLEPLCEAVCPACGKRCSSIHESTGRIVRDAPLMTRERVYVHFEARRVQCSCGCHRTERLPWVSQRSRLTNLMIANIQSLLQLRVSISDVAAHYRLGWDTVKACDKVLLKYLFQKVDFTGVKHLAIDEFAVHKGHRYATVVMDLDTRRILWVGKGKSRRDVEPFFELLRQHHASGQIQSVSCDMNAAYPRMVKDHLKGAVVVYDLFHVMANFIKEVLTEAKTVIREQIRKELRKNSKIRENEETRKSRAGLVRKLSDLKSAEWVLARRPDDLQVDRQEQLNRLKADNELLASLYPIADLIRRVWCCRSEVLAREELQKTKNLLEAVAEKHDFSPARRFAKMLGRRAEGIVNAGKFKLGTGPLEGANNAIKVLKRMAYGFRDFEYFVLKIKSIFPGRNLSPWRCLPDHAAVLKSGLWVPTFPGIP
jgi:transposase